ncbi:hypothetical protein C8Q77DRAFT_1104172 [Trametes polyzona]|nr:hypothetical protein C8Q77DRAFT_1104172 [Trametes polyzona]
MNRDNGPGRKPFSPDRRCHWFDANGRPFKRLDGGLGCPRNTKCYFAHPTDAEAWRNARPGGEPPLHYLTDDEYRLIVGRHRSPPRGGFHPGPRMRSDSPGRRRSPPRRSSREREMPSLASRIRGRTLSRERELRRPVPRNSRSRSPRRIQRTPPPRGPRPSISGPHPDGARGNAGPPRSPVIFPKVEPDVAMRDITRPTGYRREDSVASSHQHPQQATPSRPSAHTSGSGQTQGHSSVNAASNTSTAGSAHPDAFNNMLESSALEWQKISTALAAASSVTTTNKPRAASNGTSSEGSMDDRAKVWSNRIELLAAAVQAYNECRALEKEVSDYKQLVESFSYKALPAADRVVIEKHLTTLEARLAPKTEEFKGALKQLAEAKFWSTYSDHTRVPPQESGQEIEKHVQGLKVSVSQLQGLFQTVGTRWEQVAKTLQSNRLSNIGSSNAMDISGPAAQGGQANTLVAEAIIPKELEKIRNSIASFAERLKAVENAALQSGEAVMEEIDAVVAENVQALLLAATGSVQATVPPPRPANTLTAQQRKMLETLQQNAAVTAQQVQQLSQKVTDMAAANDQLQGENAQLQAENARLRQQLSETMVGQLPTTGDDSAKLDQMQAEMRAMNAAVVAWISQSPSSGPAAPPADVLAQQIAQHLIPSLPKALNPELQGLRNELQQFFRDQQAESLEKLASNVSYTRQLVDVIRQSIEGIQTNIGAASRTPPAGANGIKGEDIAEEA